MNPWALRDDDQLHASSLPAAYRSGSISEDHMSSMLAMYVGDFSIATLCLLVHSFVVYKLLHNVPKIAMSELGAAFDGHSVSNILRSGHFSSHRSSPE